MYGCIGFLAEKTRPHKIERRELPIKVSEGQGQWTYALESYLSGKCK